MNFGSKALVLASAVTMALGASAHAAVVASDGFENYTTGALNGQGAAGNGWSGAWTANTYVTIIDKSLSYSNGSINISGGSKAAQAVYPNAVTDIKPLVKRSFTTQTSGTVYMSMLIQTFGDLSGDVLSVGLQDSNANSANNSAGFNIGTNSGKINSEVYISSNNSASRTPTSTTAVAGTTYLIVVRINPSGGSSFNSVDVIVNPSSTDEATAFASSASLTQTFNTADDLGSFVMRIANIDPGDGFYFDNLTIGTTYHDVISAVPEPAGVALLTVGAGSLLLGHKPRRQ